MPFFYTTEAKKKKDIKLRGIKKKYLIQYNKDISDNIILYIKININKNVRCKYENILSLS